MLKNVVQIFHKNRLIISIFLVSFIFTLEKSFPHLVHFLIFSTQWCFCFTGIRAFAQNTDISSITNAALSRTDNLIVRWLWKKAHSACLLEGNFEPRIWKYSFPTKIYLLSNVSLSLLKNIRLKTRHYHGTVLPEVT